MATCAALMALEARCHDTDARRRGGAVLGSRPPSHVADKTSFDPRPDVGLQLVRDVGGAGGDPGAGCLSLVASDEGGGVASAGDGDRGEGGGGLRECDGAGGAGE